MSRTTIHVCLTCRDPADETEGLADRAGARLHRALAALATERGADVAVVGVECLSVCKRPCTIGFAAPGKWSYVYGDFRAEGAAATILDAAALYGATTDGLIPWKQRPEAIKKGVVSRLPPLPVRVAGLPEAAE